MSSPAPYLDARAKLTAAGLGVPIEWENEPFETPDPPGLFLSVAITGDLIAPIELGGGAWSETGRLYVAVIVPAFSGTDDARSMAKRVASVFRDLGPQDVVWMGGSIGAGHTSDPAGVYWQLDVVLDYRYVDILT